MGWKGIAIKELYCNLGGLAGEVGYVTIQTLYHDCSCLNGLVCIAEKEA